MYFFPHVFVHDVFMLRLTSTIHCILTIVAMYSHIFLDDETLHFFEVSFTPKRSHNKLTTGEVSPYQLLHHSNTESFFLKVYENTVKASDKSIEIPVKLTEMRHTEHLLKIPKVDNIYVHKEIEMALEPKFVHHGLLRILCTTDPKLSLEHCIERSLVTVNYEVPRGKAFMEAIRASVKDEFILGRIKLPEKFRKPYCKFGRSINDLCIVHKTFYKQEGKVTAGVIVANEDNSIEVLDKNNDIVFDGLLIKGGVIEFKNKKYVLSQTIKEMLKCAGDLLAKTLIQGSMVDHTTVFGLALNLDSKRCLLVTMYVDFIKEKTTVIHSDEAVHVYVGLNWLLNCIK